MVTLTKHQTDCLLALESIGKKIGRVNLRGLAGTGKTTCLIELARRHQYEKLAIVAPTNRAVAVLGAKLREAGIQIQPTTVHRFLYTPTYAPEFAEIKSLVARYLTLESETSREWVANQIVDYCTEFKLKPGRVRSVLDRHPKIAPEIGMRLFGVRPGAYLRWRLRSDAYHADIILCDESSLLREEDLRCLRDKTDLIYTIGDHGQLGPVRSEKERAAGASYKTVLEDGSISVDLTEVHRQKGSLLAQANRIRQGGGIHPVLDIESRPYACAQELLRAPLLVWTNRERIHVNTLVREALGYSEAPVPGEPLICYTPRSRDPFYRNSWWTVVERTEDDRYLLLSEDGCLQQSTHLSLFDGVQPWSSADDLPQDNDDDDDDGEPDSEASECIEFRFGYASTVHCAQSSEWPRIFISRASINQINRRGANQEERKRWNYTAVTRAREKVIIIESTKAILDGA